MIFIRIKYFILIIFFINTISIKNVYAEERISEEVIKVGLYISDPYCSIDSNGNVSGYYHDIFQLIQEKCNFQYEYVIDNFSDNLKNLQEGNIDIMLGVSILKDRIGKSYFTKTFITREKYAIFTNKDIKFNELKNIQNLKIALVKNTSSTYSVLDYFSKKDINLEYLFVDDWQEAERLLREDKVDLTVSSLTKKDEFKVLYELEGDQVYIAVNKDRKDLLNIINATLNEFINKEKENPMYNIYKDYFEDNYSNIKLQQNILVIMIIVTIFIFIFFIKPNIKKYKIKRKIRNNISKDKYLLQYQPIYNIKDEEIIAFEGLLRLLNYNNELIPPYKFIPEIEKNNMLYEVSLWILQKAIDDYNKIKEFNCMKNKEFYISINLSLNEIENDSFTKKAIEILNKSNLGANKICLEIIERVKSKNLNNIIKSISELKKAGFKIAIDDFGVEYSNLDIIQKLDADIIKVDKHFIDEIGTDDITTEIILFICKIAETQNQSVVLEGVESKYQNDKIKDIKNKKVYVQGYFYSKPLYIENIELLSN